MGVLGKLSVILGLKSDEFSAGLNKAQGQTKSFSQNATAALGKVAAQFLSVAAAIRILGDGVRTMKDFERANSTLASVLGKSTNGIKELTQAAVDLGKKTMYTASQVTELQTSLARLGFDQSQILDMQEGVLKFAAAVGTDLGRAADFTGSALRAFGLQSKDTTALLDVMAASTSKSALNFEKLETSISIVAPVANAFGLSAADTVALLGALSNAGFDASSAATAFRNILLNLADSNGALAKGLGHTAKTFPEIIAALKECDEKGIDLNTTLQMTDKRSVSAFSSLIKGADDVSKLREELGKANGTMETMYSTMTDNLTGAVNELKSAWEGLVLTFREANGPMANITRNLADWLNMLSDLRSGKSGSEAFTNFSNTRFDRAVAKTIQQNRDNGTDSKEGYQRAVDNLNAEIKAKMEKIMKGGNMSIFGIAALEKLQTERAVLLGAMEQLFGNDTPVNNANNPAVTGTGRKGESGSVAPQLTDEELKKREEELKRIDEIENGLLDKRSLLLKKYGEEAELFQKYGKDISGITGELDRQLGLLDIEEENDALAALAQETREVEDASDGMYESWRALHDLPPIDEIIDPDLVDVIKEADKALAELGNTEQQTQKYAVDLETLLAQGVNSAVQGFSDAMQEMFDQFFAMDDMDGDAIFAALLKPLAETAKKMGEIMLAAGIAMTAFGEALTNPLKAPLLIAAGSALIAIGAAASAALSSLAASGSNTATTTTGSSMAAATTSSAELTVYVKGTIKGSDILISGQNTQSEWNK